MTRTPKIDLPIESTDIVAVCEVEAGLRVVRVRGGVGEEITQQVAAAWKLPMLGTSIDMDVRVAVPVNLYGFWKTIGDEGLTGTDLQMILATATDSLDVRYEDIRKGHADKVKELQQEQQQAVPA